MQNERLPKLASPAYQITAREAWRLFGIMAEFVEDTERLAGIRPAVSMFGTSRVLPDSPYYLPGRAHRAAAL
jgi:hypothetical protein